MNNFLDNKYKFRPAANRFNKKEEIITTQPISNEYKVSGYKVFELFRKKRIKLLFALISGVIGVFGNYYAIKHQIDITRIDMKNVFSKQLYAFGVSALLDVMIIVFHLMRVDFLMWSTTFVTVIISIYANLSVVLSTKGNSSVLIYGGSFLTSLSTSLLPVIILIYLMQAVVKQYDEEVKLCNSLNKKAND